MIKINLATKKQASYTTSTNAGGVGTQTILGRIPVSKEDLQEIPIRKILLSLVACLLGGMVLDDLKMDKIKSFEKEIAQKTEKLERIKKITAKTQNIVQLQKQLEADEFVIQTKIDTINKLIVGRRKTAEMLISLSKLIPNEVWLSAFRFQASKVTIDGRSKDFNFVSDFMKKLGESPYFSKLSLDSTNQVILKGNSLAEFKLRAEDGSEK